MVLFSDPLCRWLGHRYFPNHGFEKTSLFLELSAVRVTKYHGVDIFMDVE